jgi:methylthioribose-1-phosphate isomerase
MSLVHDRIRAIVWRDGVLELLDQRLLPERIEYRCLPEVGAVAEAIKSMVVRGAPAIGITAAYGVVLAACARFAESPHQWRQRLAGDLAMLAAARPTAVNLSWALGRMASGMGALDGDPTQGLLAEAQAIHAEDIAANRRMGELGAGLLDEHGAVLTHCNTGSLATGGYGTALGVIRSGFAAGAINKVYADETRPWLQGSRLTAWELAQDAIPVTLLVDGAASYLLSRGEIGWVIVGADRVASNGDVANKIGTYNLAVSARHHGVRFMVVAPTSTVDMAIEQGAAIPIEQRGGDELFCLNGQRLAARGVDAWNPVFDVTPAALVDALVTELGVVLSPTRAKLSQLMSR